MELENQSPGGERKTRRTTIAIPREVLLIEVERYCPRPGCRGKTRIGLTKEEARAYTGYTCERCEQEIEDVLTERDVPEWWEELAVTGLHGLRNDESRQVGPGEVIARMSDGYRRLGHTVGTGEDRD